MMVRRHHSDRLRRGGLLPITTRARLRAYTGATQHFLVMQVVQDVSKPTPQRLRIATGSDLLGDIVHGHPRLTPREGGEDRLGPHVSQRLARGPGRPVAV